MEYEFHVWGKSKPQIRFYDRFGKYQEYRNAVYSGHMIASTIQEAQEVMNDYLKRNWNVDLVVVPKN